MPDTPHREPDSIFSALSRLGVRDGDAAEFAGAFPYDHGFILTGADIERAGSRRLPLETSVAGVFAVGDIRHGSIKRVATAVGEGAMAVRVVHERLASPVLGS